MGGSEQFDRNLRLVRERLDRELDHGTAYVEDRIADLVAGPAGVLVNPAAKLVYRWIGERAVKRRTRRQLGVVADLARDLDEAPASELVERRREDLLATEEVYVRGRESHDRFDEVVDILQPLHVQRLQVVGTLLREGEGETYPELVRSVYDREEIEAVVEDHFERTWDLLALVREERALLPIPPGLRDPVWTLVEDTVAWYEERMKGQLADIFDGAAEADRRLSTT